MAAGYYAPQIRRFFSRDPILAYDYKYAGTIRCPMSTRRVGGGTRRNVLIPSVLQTFQYSVSLEVLGEVQTGLGVEVEGGSMPSTRALKRSGFGSGATRSPDARGKGLDSDFERGQSDCRLSST